MVIRLQKDLLFKILVQKGIVVFSICSNFKNFIRFITKQLQYYQNFYRNLNGRTRYNIHIKFICVIKIDMYRIIVYYAS